MLSNSGQDMHSELVGVGIIYGHELDPTFHQRSNESQVAAQPIELGNHQLGLLPLAGRKCVLKLWPIIALTATVLATINKAKYAAVLNLSSGGGALNEARTHVGIALSNVIHGMPTQEKIDKAKRAIDAWIRGLEATPAA
jgi:hypothetical protein